MCCLGTLHLVDSGACTCKPYPDGTGIPEGAGVEFWAPQNVPPNSQDFSLCDYDIWSYIEGKVCKTSSSSLALLRCHIRAVRSTTPADKIRQLFSHLKSYFQKPFEAKGP